MINENDRIQIGDRVRYSSAEGIIRGELVDIYIAKNAKDEMVPWFVIEMYNGRKAVINGLESFTVLFR